MKSLQIYFLISFLSLGHIVLAQSLKSLTNTFVSDSKLNRSNISLLAIDLETGDTIVSWHPNMAFATASTTKLFSTALSYELLGPDYTMKTDIFFDNAIENGELKGNLWIKGGGDVSFASTYFNDEKNEFEPLDFWIDTLVKSGLKKITGMVVVDGSEFGYAGAPLGWAAGDLGTYYGAVYGGINLHDNVVDFYFNAEGAGSKPKFSHSYPPLKGLNLVNLLTTGKGSNSSVSVSGKPYEFSRTFKGVLPENKNKYSVEASMPDPEKVMAQFVLEKFLAAGIKVANGSVGFRTANLKSQEYDNKIKFLTHEGKSIDQIAKLTNHRSINLFAEALLRSCSYKICGDGSTIQAVKIELEYWKTKMETSGLILCDGSGLSRRNAISAAHFCRLLEYMTHSQYFDNFYATLPIFGQNGTVKNLCKGQVGQGRIHAKSGTLTGVKSYAGYIETLSGRTLAFAITANGFNCSSSYVISKMEQLLNGLAAL